MANQNLDVVGIGNPIVDVLAKCDDHFLETHSITKGSMTLIDEDRATTIHKAMPDCVVIPGGSAANSIACLASLGGKGGFVGKVADDELGRVFQKDLQDQNIEFTTKPLQNSVGTGRCLVNVTPDAQRSMMTFLGAASLVSPEDIDTDQAARTKIIFCEGYLFELEDPRAAFMRACEITHKAGHKSAMTLSDTGVVERQFDVLQNFIPDHVDILLANENEAQALFQSTDINEIATKARQMCELTAITLSEKGSVIIPREGEMVSVQAITPTKLEDTTGAGDAWAAGFMLGIARGYGLEKSGSLGSLAASEVISHMGPRPEQQLLSLAKSANLL